MNKENNSLPSTILERLLNGILKENPTFVLLLGMCPTLAVTTSAVNGLGMGLSTMVVLALSNMLISALRKIIPNKVRIPAFIVIIASFVTMVELLLKAYIPFLYDNLGLYIPLIVVNCIILGRAEAYAYSNPVLPSLFDGIGMGLGFSLALTIIGGIREIIGSGEIFGFHIMPASYIPVSIFVMAPGAFFVLALLTAIQNAVKIAGEKKGKDMSKIQSGCGGNCIECEKDCKKPEAVNANAKNKKSDSDEAKAVTDNKDTKEKVNEPKAESDKSEAKKSKDKKSQNKAKDVSEKDISQKPADKESTVDEISKKSETKSESTSEEKVEVKTEEVPESKADSKDENAASFVSDFGENAKEDDSNGANSENSEKSVIKKIGRKNKKDKETVTSQKTEVKAEETVIEADGKNTEVESNEKPEESTFSDTRNDSELDPEVEKLLEQMESENQSEGSEEEIIFIEGDGEDGFELIDIDDYKKALSDNKKKSAKKPVNKPNRKKGGMNKAKEMLTKAEETVKGETDK